MKHFCERILSRKYHNLHPNRLPNGSRLHLEGATIQKKYEKGKVCLDCTGVYGLHMSPYHGMLSATQNRRKKPPHSLNTFFYTICVKKHENMFQKVSKWVTLFRWWRLLGHPWRPSLFFDPQNEPTARPKCLQSAPRDQTIPEKLPQSTQSAPKTAQMPKFAPIAI